VEGGVVTELWLDEGAEAREFSPKRPDRVEAQLTSYSIGARVSFSGDKATGAWTGCSPASGADIKNTLSYNSISPYAFMSYTETTLIYRTNMEALLEHTYSC
jgi:hypothetical protein